MSGQKRGRIGLIGKIFGGLVLLGLAGVLVAAGIAALYVSRLSRDLPEYTSLREYQPPVMTRIHTGEGTILAEYANERRIFVPIASMPPRVLDAFISAEDKNFFEHDGLDYAGIVRAAMANVSNYMNNRRLEGASTITQQVAKNFLLSGEVRMERKIKEAVLARRIEQAFSKQKILELYLNEIYLGWRSYGVAAAALNYFDKSLDDLTIAEAAYLAAMPKAPNNYRPDRVSTRQRGIDRRNWVIERMAANGYITWEEARQAQAEELVIYERPFGSHTVEYEFFAEEVRRQVSDIFGEDSLYNGGLSVRTTLEPRLQRAALIALRDGLAAYDRRRGWRGPAGQIDRLEDWSRSIREFEFLEDAEPWQGAVVLDVDARSVRIGLQDGMSQGTIAFADMDWARPHQGRNSKGYPILGPAIGRADQVLAPGDVIYVERLDGGEQGEGDDLPSYALRQIPDVDGGIVAMDPHTGRVLAMIGGFSFARSEFNRATQARRQPGSAFKPFVFAPALDRGYTPSSVVLDAPLTRDQGEGKERWKPDNYSGRFYGLSTLRKGMEKSYNALTLRVAYDIGVENVVRYAQSMGVLGSVEVVPALALGSGETTLMNMVTAYSMFVNGGRKVSPVLIDQVQDRYGRTIYQWDQRSCDNCRNVAWEGQREPTIPDNRERVVDPYTAYQIVSLLEGVVQRGTATSVAAVGRPVAGKTGTTNEERDAWFVGFTPDLAVGVYVGFDEPKPMGRGETGGKAAAPIFQDFITAALDGEKARPFRVPDGMTLITVNAETGQPASHGQARVITEAFRPGTGPDPDAWESQRGAGGPQGQDGQVSQGTGGLY